MSKARTIITRNEIDDIKSDMEEIRKDISTLEDFVLKLIKVSPHYSDAEDGDEDIPKPTKPKFKNLQGFRPKEDS